MIDCKPRLPIFPDITTRKMSEVPPVDLYVAGPSCPPWSKAGLRSGGAHPLAGHMQNSVDYIVQKRPLAFVLENVAGLVQFKAVMTRILSQIQAAGFKTCFKVLDTKEHGIPHSRPRIFIVGFRRDAKPADRVFKFPKTLPHPPVSIKLLLEHKNKRVEVVQQEISHYPKPTSIVSYVY